jgi:nitrite reductase/ring-hydroxylating ferredoxin subunit
MPEIVPLLPSVPLAPPQRLCASEELAEKGKAIVFDVLHYREPARAFAMRFDGKVVCYLNRCVHVPTELDWQPGEFLDSGKEFILCSIHGAAYEPRDGLHRRPLRPRQADPDPGRGAGWRGLVAADRGHPAGAARRPSGRR